MDKKGRKRKYDEEPVPKCSRICIIHIKESKSKDFTFISDTKDPEARFSKILDIRQQRLAQPIGSANRMEDTCIQIPSTCETNHGYHRDCYQRYTSNLARLNPATVTQSSASESRDKRRLSTECDKHVLKPDCIFCNKEGKKAIKVRGVWTTETMSKFEFEGGETVLKEAEHKDDQTLLRRISGLDLFACEAMYHKSCRVQYLQRSEKWRSKSEDQTKQQSTLEEAHRQSFLKVCDIVDKDVINDKKVLKLTDLKQVYISTLHDTAFPNPNYRGEKLKSKLDKCELFAGKLGFCPVGDDGRFHSYLIYNTNTDLGDAVKNAFLLGSSDKVQEVAIMLRNTIMNAFKTVDDMPWPPTAQYLENQPDVVPDQLQIFLKVLLSGNDRSECVKINRLADSISQDICRAATNGQWKLRKHILVGMTLRHLFRSAELITLINRLGHCENYCFILELETAIATALQQASSLLSVQIIRNPSCSSTFHSDFDNFDEYVNDITGSGSVHRAHGIMLQELVPTAGENIGGSQPEPTPISKTGRRSLMLQPEENLAECYVGKRKSPGYEIVHNSIPDGEEEIQRALQKNLLWILIRLHSSKTEQEVPGWGGYISLTGDVPSNLTTIEYYPIISQPITDYKTVQECLRYSEQATEEVGQDYVITTFDLGVCMKAYPLLWNDPHKYEKHIVMIGTFHLICGYLKMIGKKMEGTGLSDILMEAGLISSGSMLGVMSGKNYSRAMNCHKVIVESLERLLFEQFLNKRDDDSTFASLPDVSRMRLQCLIESPSKETQFAVLTDELVMSYVDEYIRFRDTVRTGTLGKTAQFWLSYMDHVWLTLSLVQAVKTNNYLEYSQCLFMMPDLFFSFSGQNYARYLTYFSLFIANVEISHPGATELLKRGAISVARSFIPGNRCGVDKTIEETFMRHAKSRGGGGSGAGLSGLFTNYDAYQRWSRTAGERARYLQATLSMADMLTESNQGRRHRDIRAAEILRSERSVARTMEAINGFISPFTIEDKERLYVVSSGAPTSSDVEIDVMRAETAGNESKVAFITDRLEKKDRFFEPIKRLNLKTMANMNKKVKVKTSNNKTIEYKHQGNIAFQLLVHSQNLASQTLDLHQLMSYPLTPVPYSIGTADGFLAKTNKAKGLHHLTKDVEDDILPPDEETIVIEDGNAVFYYLREVPDNFGKICEKLFNLMVNKPIVIFSTDMYKLESVKSVERLRRGCAEKLIISGEKTKRPKDWKTFLSNDDNKKQLIQVLHSTWSSASFAPKLANREVILICEGIAYQITSDGKTTSTTELSDIQSTQEETDSRVILYCMYARDRGFRYARIRSPDTDIFFILLHYAIYLTGIVLLFETGTGNRKRCINVTRMAAEFMQQQCSALMAVHAFTGCDSTSAFKGIGKVKAVKLIQMKPKYQIVFAKVGKDWNVDDELFEQIEEFTCAMYGKPRLVSINELRYCRLKEKCGLDGGNTLNPSKNFDISALPPCQSCLKEHTRRVNYQVGLWKRSHIAEPIIPVPTNGHGWTSAESGIEPLWTSNDILPQQLVDILDTTGDEQSEESDEDSTSYEYEEVSYSEDSDSD